MQLGHRRLALGGAFLNALFKVGRELIQFFQSCPSLILPATPPQRRSSQADKRVGWNGRSRKVTFPRTSRKRPASGLRSSPPPRRVRSTKGKSDHSGCPSSHSESA